MGLVYLCAALSSVCVCVCVGVCCGYDDDVDCVRVQMLTGVGTRQDNLCERKLKRKEGHTGGFVRCQLVTKKLVTTWLPNLASIFVSKSVKKVPFKRKQ